MIASVRLANSRLGRAWLYVRHDEDAAEAMGINRVAVKLAAYVIGAIFGAVGGAFFAINLGAISPESFSFAQSVLILMAVILGGMGKIPGVILGAFIVILAPELLRDFGTVPAAALRRRRSCSSCSSARAASGRAGARDERCRSSTLNGVHLAFAGNTVLENVDFAVADERRSSASSARTAPARPRSSTASPASTSRRPARSASTARSSWR